MDSGRSMDWKVVDGYYPGFRELKGASFTVSVVLSATDLTFADSVRREDDLRLMAAAPDLLKALIEARQYVYDYGSEKSMAPVVERIDAAIAKAKGES